MARFTAVNTTRSVGLDEEKGLLIIQAGKTAQLFLVAGENLDVTTDDPEICKVISAADKDVPSAHRQILVTAGEKGQSIRLVTLKAGPSVGNTELHASSGGLGWAQTITIRVVMNADRRQVGANVGEVATQAIRDELNQMSLREAVTRIAEDQMNSNICLGDGFGSYMPKEIDPGVKADWCGAFAYFCWQQAAAIKNVPNPFGGNSMVLWSPQRAISWAMRNTDKVAILRYEGGDPGTHPDKNLSQQYRDVGWSGYNLERGDIVMLRQVPFMQSNGKMSSDWKHVTQIDWVGEKIHTVDGNQGSGACIKRRSYDLYKKLTNGKYELAFLHVLV